MTEDVLIICVGCPMGCMVKLTVNNKDEVIEIADNKCKEGKQYATQEYKNPVRLLTATVLTNDSIHTLLPVRTNKPIPKKLLVDGMQVLAKVTVKPPVKSGDVIVTNLLNTGSDLIASSELLN